MKLVALMPVRNEDWILRASVEIALQWCDAIVILDHRSEDGTERILHELEKAHPKRVLTRVRGGPWDEMEHRQALLEAGRAIGGTHFALIDADELLTASALGAARREVEKLAPGECLDVPMLPVWGDLEHVRSDDCVWTRAWLTLAFADAPHLTWQPREDGYQHHHRAPYGAIGTRRAGYWTPAEGRHVGGAGVMHLQFANPRRLRAKHALYKMIEVLRWPGRESVGTVDAKYNQALDETGMILAPCPTGWWYGYDKTQINLEGIPWQEDEVKRLREKHGDARFAGLELWGIGA